MDYFDLGSAPADERCAQLGVDNDYEARVHRECRALIRQFHRLCGDPPLSIRFRIMANPHDFGIYYSVAIHFDPNDSQAVAYACPLRRRGAGTLGRGGSARARPGAAG